MFDQAARFAGDAIPSYYDSGLGPFLFADYAADLARRAAAAQPAAIMAALAVAPQREFGQDSGCTTMQAIVFSARKP